MTVFQQFGPAQLVGVVEAFADAGFDGFEGEQIGPAAQEIHRQGGVEFAHQLKGLRIVVAQQAGDLIEHLGAAVHQVAPGLDQAGQFDRLGILGFQRAEFGGVVADQFEEDAGVAQVVAGTGGGEGRAVTGAGDGVDGIDRDPGVTRRVASD